MNLDDWISEAHSDEAINLCAFNFERDRVGGTREWGDESNVTEAFSRFEGFLASRSTNTSHNHCAEMLASFSNQDIQDNRSSAAAYLGMATEGVSEFIALKSLIFVERNGASLGYSTLECAKIAKTVATKMSYKSYGVSGDGEFNAAARRMADTTLKNAIEASSDTTAAMAVSRTPSRPTGTTALTLPPTDENWGPIWVTEKLAIDALGPAPEADESQRLRSAYVAGLKDHLGLSDPSDIESDYEFGLGTYERTARFRMKVLLGMKLTTEPAPRQPCLFSLGDKAIWVSRKEPKSPSSGLDTMPGRTVHLEDRSCSHAGTCNCNRPGLPEAVMPEVSFLREQPKLLTQAVLFERDLQHRIGPTSEIRSKNPV